VDVPVGDEIRGEGGRVGSGGVKALTRPDLVPGPFKPGEQLATSFQFAEEDFGHAGSQSSTGSVPIRATEGVAGIVEADLREEARQFPALAGRMKPITAFATRR
jgi:hypothetical protein